MNDVISNKLLSYLAFAIEPDRCLDKEIHSWFSLPESDQPPQYTASTQACASLIELKLPGLRYAFTEE